MINLLVNLILFVLHMFNAVTFGLIDNLATVYSILVFSTFFVILKLDSVIQICDFWRKSGKFIKTILFFGVLLNSLPQWYLWLIGMILIILAYFLSQKRVKNLHCFRRLKLLWLKNIKKVISKWRLQVQSKKRKIQHELIQKMD